MLKFFALALLALHCNCQRVIEVRGDNIIRSEGSDYPVKTVSGLSHIGGLSRIGGLSTIGGLSGLNSGSYLSSIPSLNYGLSINGANLGYLNSGLRHNVYGGQDVNIAPSIYGYGVSNPRQNYLAIREGTVQSYGGAQPAFQTIGVAQPHIQNIGIAQPAYQSIGVAQPQLAIARQQIHVAQPQHAVHLARPHVLSTGSEAVHPVSAAIQQVGRTVEYRNVAHHEAPIVPQEVVVEPSDQPINIHFRSKSSTVRLSQEHIAGEPGTVEQTQSQDEPSKLEHEVVKPVIQEVREVIQPYRQVTQEIQPVVENVHRIVSSGDALRQQYVAEQPLVRQLNVQGVRQVQQVQPLAYAVARPAISVAQPISYAQRSIQIARPAISVAQPIGYAQRSIAIGQPAYAQYQTLALPEAYQPVQPIVSSIVRRPVIQNIDQPIIGYNRIVEQQPSISIRQEVREPEFRVQRQDVGQEIRQVRQRNENSNTFVDHAESDD